MLEQYGSDSRSLVLTDGLRVQRQFISKKFNLVNSSANNLWVVPLPAGAMFSAILHWSLQVTDGTDMQTFTGITTITAVNKAGTYTSTVTELAGIQSKAVSAGTLTESVSIVTGTNQITIALTPTSSLTPTALTLDYNLMINCGEPVLPQ